MATMARPAEQRRRRRELADEARYDGEAHTEVERGKARWLRCGLAKDGSGSRRLVDACSCEDLTHQEVTAAERSCAPWLTQLPARHLVDAGARIEDREADAAIYFRALLASLMVRYLSMETTGSKFM
ncbi:unnamed protein product [Urochloa humidicola]